MGFHASTAYMAVEWVKERFGFAYFSICQFCRSDFLLFVQRDDYKLCDNEDINGWEVLKGHHSTWFIFRDFIAYLETFMKSRPRDVFNGQSQPCCYVAVSVVNAFCVLKLKMHLQINSLFLRLRLFELHISRIS